MKDFFAYDFDVQNVTVACYIPKNSGATVHNNRPWHGLSINLDGEKVYTFQSGEKIRVKKNDIIYLPKGSSYHVKGILNSDCYAINFTFFNEVTFQPFAVEAKNAANFIEQFKESEAKWSKKSAGYHTKCKANLYNILYQLQREYRSGYCPKDKSAMIRAAVSYIHSNYTEKPLYIPELAAMCGITPEYFRSLFAKIHGLAPAKYIRNLKMTRAKELLESGLYTVSEACFMSGFHDESYFSREFKKHFNIAPSEYAKASRN